MPRPAEEIIGLAPYRGAGPRQLRSSATRTPSRRYAVAPPSRGRRGGGPRPARPSSTWDRFTSSARRGPPRGRRDAAGRRRRSTTTTRSTRDLRRSGFTSTTTRRVVPSTKPPDMPRRSSRRTTCRLLGISCSVYISEVLVSYRPLGFAAALLWPGIAAFWHQSCLQASHAGAPPSPFDGRNSCGHV